MKISEKIKSKFLSKVRRTSGCWHWIAGKKGNGYGEFWFKNKMAGAHRVSYLIHKGKIPLGKFVLHTCDNTSCVNPDHLWLGTQTDNMKDCSKKGRVKYFHPFILKTREVLAIKRLYFSGNSSHRKLGTMFGVSRTTIAKALKR